MKNKILFVLIGLFSLCAFAQDPYIIPMGTGTEVRNVKGGMKFQKFMAIPVRDHTEQIFHQIDSTGSMLVDSNTKLLMYHNGTEYVTAGSNPSAQEVFTVGSEVDIDAPVFITTFPESGYLSSFNLNGDGETFATANLGTSLDGETTKFFVNSFDEDNIISMEYTDHGIGTKKIEISKGIPGIIISDEIDNIGLVGAVYFEPMTDEAYAQKKYVDDAIAATGAPGWYQTLQASPNIGGTVVSNLADSTLWLIGGNTAGDGDNTIDRPHFSLNNFASAGTVMASLGTEAGGGFLKYGIQVYKDKVYLRGPVTVVDQPLNILDAVNPDEAVPLGQLNALFDAQGLQEVTENDPEGVLPYADARNVKFGHQRADSGLNGIVATPDETFIEGNIVKVTAPNGFEVNGYSTIAKDHSSAGASLDMETVITSTDMHFTNTGAASAWLAPPVAGFTSFDITIVNLGSADITLDSNAAANDFFTGTLVNTLAILPNTGVKLHNNGTYWIISEINF